jgi:hypothetical protein
LTKVAAQTAPTASSLVLNAWDDILPTSSHNRILIKASFKKLLEPAPILRIGDQRISGVRSDTRGSFWQFHAGDLKAGTSYELSLVSSDGHSLCQPWTLSTMPAPDDCQASFVFWFIRALVGTILLAALILVSSGLAEVIAEYGTRAVIDDELAGFVNNDILLRRWNLISVNHRVRSMVHPQISLD